MQRLTARDTSSTCVHLHSARLDPMHPAPVLPQKLGLSRAKQAGLRPERKGITRWGGERWSANGMDGAAGATRRRRTTQVEGAFSRLMYTHAVIDSCREGVGSGGSFVGERDEIQEGVGCMCSKREMV